MLSSPFARRSALVVLLSALLVVGTAASAQASRRETVMASAAGYAAASGYHVGIAVIDTQTGTFYGSGHYTDVFASESVVKVFIATRLLISGQMHGDTSRRAYTMITQSDDGIASSLYGRVGGDGLINWVKGYFHVADLGYPPSRAGWWGNTHIRPSGLVRLYAKLKANRRVGPWLLNAMHHATQYGSDGTYQFFGLPSATGGAAVKQGWGADGDDWSRAVFNTTGFVNHDRYAVAILASGPGSTYGSQISDMLTQTAKRLLPHGVFPAPTPTITGLSQHTGRAGGGATITVFGTDFTGVQHVYFGGVPSHSVRTLSSHRLRVVTPAHTPGRFNVRVQTDHGTTTRVYRDFFLFRARPAITVVRPHSGSTLGGTRVTVKGSGFTPGTSVTFGSKDGRSVQVLSKWRLTVTAPPGARGDVSVRVRTPYGTSPFVAADRFSYGAPPTVTAVNPNSGRPGRTVTISGTGFTPGSRVLFGTTAAAVTARPSSTALQVTVPAHPAGTVNVRVVTGYGTSAAVAADRYTYA